MWTIRYWLSYALLALALAALPPGAYRDELRRRVYALADDATLQAAARRNQC